MLNNPLEDSFIEEFLWWFLITTTLIVILVAIFLNVRFL